MRRVEMEMFLDVLHGFSSFFIVFHLFFFRSAEASPWWATR